MTEQELAFINGELGVCGSRLAVLDRMIVAGGYASRTYLTDRHAEWLRYKKPRWSSCATSGPTLLT